MPNRNLYDKAFGESTITKLTLFEKYFETWLPTFIHNNAQCVTICDFFAGPGKDENSIPGSPLRILDVISRFKDSIIQKKLLVSLLLNDYDSAKCENLKRRVARHEDKELISRKLLDICVRQEDFEILFDEFRSGLETNFNLFFFDQNGFKHFTPQRLLDLDANFPYTDFFVFFSSSFLRFPDNQKRFPGIGDLKEIPNHFIHEHLCNYCRGTLPEGSSTKIYPFTIKNGANVYGILFGAYNIRAVDKFLAVAWKLDGINGTANFDIYNDAEPKQRQFDFMPRHKTKVDFFGEELIAHLKASKDTTNEDIYLYTLSKGFLPKHAKEVLIQLKKQKSVEFDPRSPYITYDQIYKNNNIIPIRWIR